MALLQMYLALRLMGIMKMIYGFFFIWDSHNIDVDVTMDNYLIKKNADLLSTVVIFT
jgi:hypothetical protein